MPVQSHRARRLGRLVPAALAIYELHSLLGSAAHVGAALHWLSALSPGSALPWLMLALALGAGVLLRESVRGLLPLLAVGALLTGPLGDHAQLLTHAFGPVGALLVIPGALLTGFLLTDLVGAVRWVLRALAHARVGPPLLRSTAPPLRRFALLWRVGPPPLLTGPSGRGPPPVALATACL